MASYSLEIFASFLAHGAHWPGVTRLKNEYKYVHERRNPSRFLGISIQIYLTHVSYNLLGLMTKQYQVYKLVSWWEIVNIFTYSNINIWRR